MNIRNKLLILIAAVVGWAGVLRLSGQGFDSGSTGADGALTVASNTEIPLPPDGILNYTSVLIPIATPCTPSFAAVVTRPTTPRTCCTISFRRSSRRATSAT